jgi:hypothetical protein
MSYDWLTDWPCTENPYLLVCLVITLDEVRERLHEKSRTVGGRATWQAGGRAHYRRLSMYELIHFNGFLNVQVANFTGLTATFRFPTATKANRSVKQSVQWRSCSLWLCLIVRKNVRIVCRIVSAPFRHDRLNVTVTVTGKVGILWASDCISIVSDSHDRCCNWRLLAGFL